MKYVLSSVAVALLLGGWNVTAEPTYRIFVTNEKDNTVSVIDSQTNKVEETIDVGKRPRGIGLAPDGSELYVAVSEENAIAVIDPKTLEVLRKFEAGNGVCILLFFDQAAMKNIGGVEPS